MPNNQETLQLTSTNIDLFSARLQDYLEAGKLAPRESQRLRLSVEDVLWQWQQRLGAEARCTISYGSRLWRTYVQLEVQGVPVNPYTTRDPDLGDGSLPVNLLSALGLAPAYSYVNGTNVLILRPAKQKLNPMLPLALAIVLGLVLGYLCNNLLSPDAQLLLADKFLKPVFSAAIRVMTMVACMLVFFGVLWGMISIGDLAFLGSVGKKMLSRTLLWIYGALVVTALIALQVYPLDINATLSLSGISAQIWQLFMDIIPGDVFSPFLKGNTLQLIFLAICTGLIMLLLDKQVEETVTIVRQINLILQRAVSYIGALGPYIVFICVLQMLVGGAPVPGRSLLKIFLLLWGTELLLAAGFVLYLAWSTHAAPFTIVKKIAPVVLVAFSTASSTTVFGPNMDCTKNRLGVDERLANLGVPLLQTILKVGDSVNFFVLALGAAEVFQVPIGAAGLAMIFILSGLLSIACPPVAGGAVTGLAIISLQLGLPQEALALCVTLAPLTDFSNTALNVWSSMTGLPLMAKSLHMLDEDVLHK